MPDAGGQLGRCVTGNPLAISIIGHGRPSSGGVHHRYAVVAIASSGCSAAAQVANGHAAALDADEDDSGLPIVEAGQGAESLDLGARTRGT